MTENPSLIDRAKEASLRYAGLGYIVGDTSLLLHGILTKNYNTAATGLFWASGGAGLALFGKKSPDYQLKELSLTLAKHLEEEGVPIPKDSKLHRDYLTNNNALFDSLERFLFNHPTQILNTVYAVGSCFLMRSGATPDAAGTRDWSLFTSGALVLAGALSGLMIPEQEQAPSASHATHEDTPDNVTDWATEKPLRLSGLFYALNNVFMFHSGYKEQIAPPSNLTGPKNAFMLKYLTGAAFLTSNALLGLSNKDRSKDVGAFPVEKLSEYARDIIRHQPPELQEKVIDMVAEHMADTPALEMSKDDAIAHLRASLAPQTLPSSTIAQPDSKGCIAAPPVPTMSV